MFTTKRKGIIALLCAVFAAALIACAISLAPSASRTAPVYAAEGDLQITEIVDANDSSETYQTVEEAVVAGIKVIIDTAEDGSYKGYSSLYNAMLTSLTGRTLILLQDCETSYMKLSNNSIIDLNGHDLVYTGTATIPFNTSGITAAITDTSVSGTGRGGTLSITGEIDGSQSVFEIAGTTSATTLNVSNITINSTGSVFYPRGAAVLNITNCDITTSGVYCVSTNAGSQANYGVTINIAGSSLTAAAEDYDDCAVMMNVSGLLNIENSVITGDRQGLFVRAGDATVVGSEIIVTGKWAEGKGEGADQYYDDEAWQSGNEAPTAAFVIGNRNGTYFADANVSIDNSTISAPDGATAIYVDATTASQGTSEESYSSNVNITGSKTVVDGDIVNNTTGAGSKSIDIAVLGGTFTADVEAYIPGDTILTQDDSGKIVEDEEKAESAVAEVDGVKYTSFESAIDAAADGETVKLLKNITVDGRVNIDKSLTLDMQGYEISGGMLYIKGGTTAGNSITVNISNGSVIGPTYGIIVFNDVTLNIKDVNISAGTHNGIFVPLKAYDGDTTVLPSTINIEGGSVSGGNTESTASVAICGVGDNSETATKLIANGTTFTGGTFGITGNGTAHNTYIELNDCVVTGSVGIYHPQDGDLIINGGEITGDVTGIEIRSGTLTVNGGTITGNGDPFESDPNGNGTTTTGAAIAVSQHTTNLPITVTINGGTFNGVRALYEADLQDEITEKVKIEVTGGTFNGEVYSENCTEFIAGGQFAEKPDDSYLDSEFTGFSEYNGMFIPVSSSTDGTLLEEIAQLRQEIDEAIAAINGELEGGDAATLADAVTALIGKMNELEDKIAELDENMVTDADLQALRNSITVAYNAAVSRVRAELSAQISDLRDSMAEMGDVSGQLDELKAAYEAADALLNADIDSVSAALAELESTYKAADDAIWNAIYALRDADSGMTTALWVIGVIAVLALCAGVAGVAFAIVRTKRS